MWILKMEQAMITESSPPIPLFINRPFVMLWLGQAISVFGDSLGTTSLVLWIAIRLSHGASWAPLATSGIFIANILPVLIIGPLAGVFVDRMDHRNLMLRADIVRAILFTSLALMNLFGSFLSIVFFLVIIYATISIAGVCAQFFNPAQAANISVLVPEPQRGKAAGLNQFANSFASVLGPPIATALFFTFGPGWALFLDAISFCASFIAIAGVNRIVQETQQKKTYAGNYWQQWSEGVQFFKSNATLRTILLAGITLGVAMSTVNTLDIFFVIGNLHASPTIYGWFGTATGIGVLVGTVLGIPAIPYFEARQALSIAVAGTGLCVVILSRITYLPIALGLLFLMGSCVAIFGVSFMQLLYAVTPTAQIGRVIALIGTTFSVSNLLIVALAGFVASTLLHSFHLQVLGQHLGSIDTIYLIAGIMALMGGTYILKIPSQENGESQL